MVIYVWNHLLPAHMIRRYNLKQTILAALSLVGGLLCCAIASSFFGWAPSYVAKNLGHVLPPSVAVGLGFLGLLATFVSGYRAWKSQGGFYGYHESALYHDLGKDSGGAVMVGYYTQQVTAPAYILSQIFLAGPLMLLRAGTMIFSRIPNTPDLEERLRQTLDVLQKANKWQSLNEYPLAAKEILYLAQMGLIDFSTHKGTPRFKAN